MIGYEADILNALDVLQKGGIILYPTDTVWGIGCDATCESAVQRIYSIKNRNHLKSMIILIADESEISHYTNQSNLQIYDYLKGIHQPTTVIYQEAKNIAPSLINTDGSIGIRIVNDPFCRELIHRFKKPIVSTSSNISGYPPPGVFSDIDILIKDKVDYIVHHRQEETVPGRPSTVVEINLDGSYKVIRP